MPSRPLGSLLFLALVAACGTPSQPTTGGQPDGGNTPKVEITSVEPAGTVALGSEIRLHGHGFGTPAVGTVTFDGTTQVSQFKAASSDTLLVLDVPTVPGIPATGGKDVTLAFSNGAGAASTRITLVQPAPQLPTGTLRVSYMRPPMTRPPSTGGDSRALTFGVKALTNMDETFTLTPVISNGWTTKTINADQTDAPEIALEKGTAPDGTLGTVLVQFTVPEGAADDASADLMLVVTSKRNPQFVGWSSLVHVALGDWPAPNYFAMGCTRVTPLEAVKAGVVEATAGEGTTLHFTVESVEPGTYKRTITVANDPDHLWTLQADASDLTVAQSGDVSLDVKLTAAAGAPATTLTVRVTSAADDSISSEVVQQIRLK